MPPGIAHLPAVVIPELLPLLGHLPIGQDQGRPMADPLLNAALPPQKAEEATPGRLAELRQLPPPIPPRGHGGQAPFLPHGLPLAHLLPIAVPEIC